MLRCLINTFQFGEKTEEVSRGPGEDPRKTHFLLHPLHITWMSAEAGQGAKAYHFYSVNLGNKLVYKILSRTSEERAELSSL